MTSFRVELTEAAERDLDLLIDHIAQDSPTAAARLLSRLRTRIDALESFPERGTYPKELDALGIRNYRQLNFGVYRLVYRLSGKTVYVLLIADGRRDMITLLQQRLLSA